MMHTKNSPKYHLSVWRKAAFLFLAFSLLLFAADRDLLRYQKRYSLCRETTDLRIAECLINGHLDLSHLRGERRIFRHVGISQIKEALRYEEPYSYVMRMMPHTYRYESLLGFVDYLYRIAPIYHPPRFQGNKTEDLIRMKQVLNLLQGAGLEETPHYTPEFEDEIRLFQFRHGLEVDGKIGPQTKRALKLSIGSLIEKVKKNLTLERLFLPKPETCIVVNIPEFQMYFYRNGEEVLSMKTVVGKPKMRTPLFSREMKYIVLNPVWNVPPSIYAKEYAGKSEEQLRKLGLRYNSEGKLYQPSGRRNALGVVKFLFPNRFNVYMHDTPAKSLFKRTKRAYSHGCIRLEKPIELLEALGYSYRPGKTAWITVQEKIPVFIEYHTVWIDENGEAQFRPDIYRYEKRFFPKR
jgi:murein L,D-transpeptidase YcbB/YkuD